MLGFKIKFPPFYFIKRKGQAEALNVIILQLDLL